MTDSLLDPSVRIQLIPVDKLHLDPLNPRLPEEMQGKTEVELIRHIAESFNAIEVARSIAKYGYFQSEPLIAIPHAEGDDTDYMVVEGNRRLAAVKILKSPELVAGIAGAREWGQLSTDAGIPGKLPVYVAKDREEVAPIIGYRHISGIQPWEPFAKARFIASFVDHGLSLEEVAEKVGEKRTSVASHYRNFHIVETARREFSLNTDPVEDDFGVFTRAMSQTKIREHIGAPAPAQVRPGSETIPKNKRNETEELLSWLFGDESRPAVIKESRDLSRLAEVLAEPQAVATLRATRNLEEARLSANGPKQRIIALLSASNSNLVKARDGFGEFRDEPEVSQLLVQLGVNLDYLANGEIDV